MPSLGGFDFRKRRSWPGWGARREFPPVNPVPIDPSVYTYISETTVINNQPSTTTTTDKNVLSIHTWSNVSGIAREAIFASPWGNRVWTANVAVYTPFILENAVTCNQFVWYNGGVVGGNTDVGIYDFAGTTKYVSTGATANAGINSTQVVNVADTVIPAGRKLWLALACDSNTQQYVGPGPTLRFVDFVGLRSNTAAYPLGASITLGSPTLANIILYGFTARSVV